MSDQISSQEVPPSDTNRNVTDRSRNQNKQRSPKRQVDTHPKTPIAVNYPNKPKKDDKQLNKIVEDRQKEDLSDPSSKKYKLVSAELSLDGTHPNKKSSLPPLPR